MNIRHFSARFAPPGPPQKLTMPKVSLAQRARVAVPVAGHNPQPARK
jgi:hypothetical protein